MTSASAGRRAGGDADLMHCPHCRKDNAATTRFCTGCGAVLVEEAPGGGRRRVLRPWGLRSSAPPTISPDFPDLADASPARARIPVDLWLAGGAIALVAGLLLLYPSARTSDTDSVFEPVAASQTVVGMTSPTVVRENRLVAPPLVEPVVPRPALPKLAVAAPAVPTALQPLPGPRPAASRGAVAVPVAYTLPPREAIITDGRSVEAAPAEAARPVLPAPVADPWQPLREDLGRCQPLGLIDRALCEQKARLAHCEGYWGHAVLCPLGRTEFGQ